MSSMVSQTGLLPVSAPAPIPRSYTLLDVARLVDGDERERWLRGAWIEGFVPGLANTFDPCSTGSDRQKEETEGTVPGPMAGTFTVYKTSRCDSRSVGPRSAAFEARLVASFEAIEAEAVERVFATADGHSTLGAFLTDANLELLASGAAVSPKEGLALLEEEIASHGTGGIIHAAPATVAYWSGDYLVEERRGQLRTVGGNTLVVRGAGYIDAAGGSQPGEEYAWATGPIEYTRSEIVVVPADYAQALDRSINDVLFIAERSYLINWVGRQDPTDSDQIQAGVLIDRGP